MEYIKINITTVAGAANKVSEIMAIPESKAKPAWFSPNFNIEQG